MPATHPADGSPRPGPDGRSLRTVPLLIAAEDEANAIVASTAGQIHAQVLRAQRDLAQLTRQVDVAVSGLGDGRTEMAGPAAPARHQTAGAWVSPVVHGELVQAWLELDRLIDGLRPGEANRTTPAPSRRLGRRSMWLVTTVILTLGGAWVVAARWMIEGPGRDLNEPVAAAPVGTVGASVEPSSSADDLRLSAERWLDTYFEQGVGPASAAGTTPTIQDEREPAERAGAAVRRVIAPARIEVFGDAAVLTTSVTGDPAPGGETTALVYQLWTRTTGQWQLDQVRIVSARSVERAFRQ